jgi:hypothetical protein
MINFRWLIGLFIAYGILTTRRTGELRMMLKGISDGVRGVKGKLDLQ